MVLGNIAQVKIPILRSLGMTESTVITNCRYQEKELINFANFTSIMKSTYLQEHYLSHCVYKCLPLATIHWDLVAHLVSVLHLGLPSMSLMLLFHVHIPTPLLDYTLPARILICFYWVATNFIAWCPEPRIHSIVFVECTNEGIECLTSPVWPQRMAG